MNATHPAAAVGRFIKKVKRELDILFDRLAFRIKLTNFGHLGLFPEQAENWQWLREAIRRRMRHNNQSNLHVLNLFAYTGGSTLAASQAGAHVVHVDAAKGVSIGRGAMPSCVRCKTGPSAGWSTMRSSLSSAKAVAATAIMASSSTRRPLAAVPRAKSSRSKTISCR